MKYIFNQLTHLRIGFLFLIESSKYLNLIFTLGWVDVRQRYSRSVIGPFWVTISTAVIIGSIATVFGSIFNQDVGTYLPYLASGMILWGYISTCIIESCSSFIASEPILKQVPLPHFVLILRIVYRNLIILAHNFVLIFLILFYFNINPFSNFLEFFIGMVLVILNLFWISLFLAIICSRYRDFQQIVQSVMQVIFYITPIMWSVDLVGMKVRTYVTNLNPFFHFISSIRDPLLGISQNLSFNWMILFIIFIIGFLITTFIYAKLKDKIIYWL